MKEETLYNRDGVIISTDKASLNIDLIHNFLHSCYWAEKIPRAIVERSIENSLCFGIYFNGHQVGFARVITDYATFAYLADVFVLAEQRGNGYSKLLMAAIKNHPQLQGLRKWMLATRDAHGLYQQFGFNPIGNPANVMEITDLEIYKR
jgi:GNAT superfamily N-acetyltransferase